MSFLSSALLSKLIVAAGAVVLTMTVVGLYTLAGKLVSGSGKTKVSAKPAYSAAE